jgi:hypothetical protein
MLLFSDYSSKTTLAKHQTELTCRACSCPLNALFKRFLKKGLLTQKEKVFPCRQAKVVFKLMKFFWKVEL